jgi:3-oxoacyl-(acyl-carrier-protein) synthase
MNVIAEARWPEPGDAELAQVPGFVVSSFNPLVANVAERCLARAYGEPGPHRDVAVVVVSGSGDAGSAEHVARTVDSGARVGPLMFFQSVPNSIAGHVAARWGLDGPVVCLCPVGDPMRDGLAQAELLIEDGDAAAALVVLVEQSTEDGSNDTAQAVLVRKGVNA